MTDKPKKPRRQRVDSAAGVAAAIVAGGKTIKLPPDTVLDAKERVIFIELCDELSLSELTPHKIRLLTLLASVMALFDREQTLLRQEGFALRNGNGNTIPNPRARACAAMHANILAMRRSLGIHTRAQAGGENRDAAKRRAINKSNEAARDNYEDNLIAFPQPLEEVDDDG